MSSKPLQIIMPERALGLVAEAAERAGCKSSTWARQTLYAALRASGVDPVAPASKSAGELYDVMGGKTRWALVADGAVLDLSYFATDPNKDEEQIALGRTWLPVVHHDSDPFDPASHWRLKPEARVDGDRVVVAFPVVEKNWEMA